MRSVVLEKMHWLTNFASILLIPVCFILYFNGRYRIKEWWKGRTIWVCLVILNILWKFLSCLLKKPISFSCKSQMKDELIQCIEKGSEMVAVYYNLTADIVIPTLNLGFCHWHWCSFGLECSSLIILETYKLFCCILLCGSLSLHQSLLHEFTKLRGGIVVG